MANQRNPDDGELFERVTAFSVDDAGEPLPLLDPSITPDSGLPVVGVDSSERVPATVLDRPRAQERPPSPLEPLPFQQRYTQRRVLGRGGMGEVRLCRDHTVGRDVAMKVIRPVRETVASMQRRFVREARVQGQLEHPAIVPVYDLGVDPDGALYFTMKRLRGASLAEVLAGLRAGDPTLTQRNSRRRLLTLFSQICLAVHFGHEKGVVHRDLKPSNLMLGDFGEVYVLDWGLAGLRGEAESSAGPVSAASDAAASLSTGVLGTPGYMAPEQIEAPHAVDARADVYALGAILFELLSLERMHGDGATTDVLVSTLAGDGKSPAALTPGRDIPPELDRLCQDCTRRAPEARLQSAALLSQHIEAYLDGDRDLLLRRELARSHAERAEQALAQTPDERDEEARTRRLAMREVSAALGLDPSHEGAQKTLVRLITEPPRQVPVEAAAEIERNQREAYLLAGRAGLVFYVGYLVYLPLLLWMGIRDKGLFALGWGTIATCALTTFILVKRPPRRIDVPLVHLAVSTFTVACVSVMFGPFVLVPMLALGNCVAYIASVGHRRGLVPLAGCLAVILPQLLRVTGVIPNNYRFDGQTWTILPSVFEMNPLATQVFVLAGIVGTLVPACLFVQRLRQAYAEAEQKLQLQAWQLRQIVPAG